MAMVHVQQSSSHIFIQYELSLPFSCIQFKKKRRKKRNLAAKQACAYFIFFLKIFLSTVLKYVQLN